MDRNHETKSFNHLFDWGQTILHRDSENIPWIVYVPSAKAKESPLDLFLEIPTHSPRNGYQLREFRQIHLEQAMEDIHHGRFDNSMIWLHDSNGVSVRSYNGLKTLEEAFEALKFRRFGEHRQPDALVRRFHINNPTTQSIAFLVWNARKSEVSKLNNFLFNYLKGSRSQASIGFKSWDGGRTFSLTFHFPSFVLKYAENENAMRKDPRKRVDGSPWRESRDLSFLSQGGQLGMEIVGTLHEAQYSFMVHGHSKSIWVSDSLIDNYFYEKSEENADTNEYYFNDPNYSEDPDDLERDYIQWDPAMIGDLDADKAPPPACEYFLLILNQRYNQIYEEWENIVDFVHLGLPNLFDRLKISSEMAPVSTGSPQELFEYLQISTERLEKAEVLLELLLNKLSSIVNSWATFKAEDIVHLIQSSKLKSLCQDMNDKVRLMQQVYSNLFELKTQCDQFRKKLVTGIGIQSGPGIRLQLSNITFVHVITPIVASASIIQAQVIAFNTNLAWFVLISLFLIAVSGRVEPEMNPVSRWLGKLANTLKLQAQEAKYHELFQVLHLQSPRRTGNMAGAPAPERIQSERWEDAAWPVGDGVSWHREHEVETPCPYIT